MSKGEALVLRAASVWTVWIWGTRIKNILENPEHSTQFKAVHAALALVSVAFAIAIWVVASRSRRRAGAAGPGPASPDRGPLQPTDRAA